MILTIDLGTTSIRCLAINTEGSCVATSQEEFSQHFPQSAWVEHDAWEIWDVTQRVIKNVFEKISESVHGVAITNQRETTVAWDRETGKPLHRAIVWQCRRTAKRMKNLSEDEKKIIKQKTGLPADAYFSASKMEWLLQNVDKIKEAANNKSLCLGTVDTWILFCLTQGKSFATDASNASRTLLMNIHTGSYDPELLKMFGINENYLPRIQASNANFGKLNITGIDSHPPIHAILGDQQAALFAQCCNEKNKLKNTYGTGLFICASTGAKAIETESLLTTIAWKTDQTTTYACEGSIFVGGSAVQWCRDQLGIIQSAAESDALASSLSDNDNIYFIPALTGLGAPHWDPHAGGMFIGLTRATSKAHLMRAVLESLAYQTKDVCEILMKTEKIEELWVDGGATENEFLMQFQADILGIPVIKTSITESTAYGVAGMAALALGLIDENKFRSWFKIKKSYEPRFKHHQIDVYYSRWKNALQRSLQWH